MDISNPIKVILVGEKDTGKTSIINRLVSDSFDQSSSATIGKNTTNYTLNKIKLNIWDTSGEEKFRTVNSLFYKGAKIVLFVYSIVDRKSFDELSHQLVELMNSNPKEVLEQTTYWYAMYDFDGSTGFDIPDRLTKSDREYLTTIASHVQKQYRDSRYGNNK